MTGSLVADGLIVLAVVIALVSGWRQGALSAVLSFTGVVAGLLIGMAVAPFVMELTDQVALRFLLAIGLLVLLVGIGQLVGATIGSNLRDRMRQRATQRVDSAVGSVFMALATVVLVWLVSIPLASNLSGSTGKAVRQSQILSTVNRYMPAELANLPTGVAAMLNESGLPPLVSPWEANSAGAQVAAPDIAVENKELVNSLRPSVIHVLGDADRCRRRLMGSGFVTADDYVVTNAHVVAGTQNVHLDTVLGLREADVVYYNPDVDIAVLHSSDLGIAPMEWTSEPATTGDDAIVFGFPQSGPFSALPARVRDRITIAGPDIYAQGRVERDAYTVRGSIQQGNSGGPMTNARGEVIGVVFGAAVDDSDTGYALTAEEVRAHIGDVTTLTAPVDTGQCVAR